MHLTAVGLSIVDAASRCVGSDSAGRRCRQLDGHVRGRLSGRARHDIDGDQAVTFVKPDAGGWPHGDTECPVTDAGDIERLAWLRLSQYVVVVGLTARRDHIDHDNAGHGAVGAATATLSRVQLAWTRVSAQRHAGLLLGHQRARLRAAVQSVGLRQRLCTSSGYENETHGKCWQQLSRESDGTLAESGGVLHSNDSMFTSDRGPGSSDWVECRNPSLRGQLIRAAAAPASVSRLAVGAPFAKDRSNGVATISKSVDPLRTYSAQQYASAPELNALSPSPAISVTVSPDAWLVLKNRRAAGRELRDSATGARRNAVAACTDPESSRGPATADRREARPAPGRAGRGLRA